MRIAVISPPYLPVPPAGYGGTELFVATLVAGLVERGHEVVLYATGDSRAPCEVRALFASGRWPPRPADARAQASWALADVAAEGFDVVQLNVPEGIAHAATLAVPVVCTLHQARDEEISRAAARARDVVFVALSRRQLELEPELARAVVIPHGLPKSAYPFAAGPGAWVAHVGRFARDKGTHLAIDAARLAGVPLRLAGRIHGADRAYFDDELRERLAGPGVLFRPRWS